jgi:hypothetical protein
MAIQDCENLWRYEFAREHILFMNGEMLDNALLVGWFTTVLLSSHKFVIAIASFFWNFKTIAKCQVLYVASFFWNFKTMRPLQCMWLLAVLFLFTLFHFHCFILLTIIFFL